MRPSSSDLEGRTRRSTVSRTKMKLWNKMIVISCVIAISLDPLFLYIPFIDEEKKCLGMDKKLRNVALILRSATDITFLVDIGYTIYEGMKKADTDINAGDEIIPFAKNLARELEWCSLVTDLLSVFPMPQLLVVKVFSKMRGWGYLERRKVLNSFLLSQYFARSGRIILSSKQLTWTTGIQMKALFNLSLYILASHVLGALWYFFSIQREISCWYWACKKHPYHEGCMSTFYCDDHITSTTVIAFLNESCGTDVPDNTKPLFDYGIFLDSLEIGNTRHIHFPTKLIMLLFLVGPEKS